MRPPSAPPVIRECITVTNSPANTIVSLSSTLLLTKALGVTYAKGGRPSFFAKKIEPTSLPYRAIRVESTVAWLCWTSLLLLLLDFLWQQRRPNTGEVL
ncbi:hypothetical protein AMTR_s00007p00236810 [Amborella trichopoda]|uniref:Uncharacterized protein n=1 Tax=Amborella trichopoda TaxID=13333 RepID=W1P6C6_AMBTC|nr:hypothetical protein AMTR_s00007p00236810 [Amborella trichopoda]